MDLDAPFPASLQDTVIEVPPETAPVFDTARDAAEQVFRFLDLPRELRDQVYYHVFEIPDSRSPRALRIERRHLTYFKSTPGAILLVLHQEDMLWNRQVAREALEVFLKKHTVFLSCGPFVLMKFLKMIQEGPLVRHVDDPVGPEVLSWLKRIELDWVTFPNLRFYPPWRWDDSQSCSERSAYRLKLGGPQPRESQTETSWDYAGDSSEYYDDNYYEDRSGWPDYSWEQFYEDAQDVQDVREDGNAEDQDSSDPFGFDGHYPFSDPTSGPQWEESTPTDARTALDRLETYEVMPLFAFLSTPPIALTSITIPLFFVSRPKYHSRASLPADMKLPLRIRYWTKVIASALYMLLNPTENQPPQEVRIRYSPYDIWASLEPTDDLLKFEKEGLWNAQGEFNFKPGDGEGEAFRAVQTELWEQGVELGPRVVDVKARVVKWSMETGGEKPGDELELVFTKKEMIEKEELEPKIVPPNRRGSPVYQ
ncbi:uncharacterized protein BDZ99DRAFT_422012 [Mytilinidion resinicola]|uniref:Uncharacterized protein n=1 Tax=Mytilinidion resinicola TaxID=574789 RepID=A0A6A6YDJ9_9PEZI|nr:uncharacterized protein BDZ99DRAFT_422012 [Mytilinidion resinicola]KAF2806800.1 hypothetical protein BDZ99DRAFT_422012 [Mytilinidion resinicola]